jgi:hypothetical protein
MIFIYASSNRAKQFFNFCGHIHPGIKLRNGKTAQKYLLSGKEKQMIYQQVVTGKILFRTKENDRGYMLLQIQELSRVSNIYFFSF